jgi:hypothetical protein
VKISLHSKVMATAVSVLALGTVVVAGVNSASSAAGLTAQSSDGSGYWMAGSDGGVFAFGTAHFYGSLAGKHLAAPISGIVATADDHGYWLVGRDGAVYPFGDATTRGSMAAKALAGPVVGIAATRPGGGAGIAGPRGPAGLPGAPGNVGPVGPAGQPNYAYVYNETPESILIESNIPFDSNGELVGFTHTAGAAEITVTNAGTYRVDSVVSATEPDQVGLFLNGVVVPGSIYGSGAGTQQNSGQVIVDLFAGDQLTLRNDTSAAAFTLSSNIGGTRANVNASILIQELAPANP